MEVGLSFRSFAPQLSVEARANGSRQCSLGFVPDVRKMGNVDALQGAAELHAHPQEAEFEPSFLHYHSSYLPLISFLRADIQHGLFRRCSPLPERHHALAEAG